GAYVEGRRKADGEPPGRLDHDRAHALDVDVGVGEAVLGALEAPDRAPELLALVHVLRGLAHRRLGDADGDRRDPDERSLADPPDDRAAAVGRAKKGVGPRLRAGEQEARERL